MWGDRNGKIGIDRPSKATLHGLPEGVYLRSISRVAADRIDKVLPVIAVMFNRPIGFLNPK